MLLITRLASEPDILLDRKKKIIWLLTSPRQDEHVLLLILNLYLQVQLITIKSQGLITSVYKKSCKHVRFKQYMRRQGRL